MKKICIILGMLIALPTFALATTIDDFTQDRNFNIGRDTSITYPAQYTESRTDASEAHIIGGRCDITLNIYSGDGGYNPYLGFYIGNPEYPEYPLSPEYPLKPLIPLYPE